MALVSVTRLRVRSWRFMPAFIVSAMRIGKQTAQAEGCLAAKVLRDRRNAFWTLTCWESEAAMKAFMTAGPHGESMRKLMEWCDEASVAHWTQEGEELPSWGEAHRRMLRHGRASKVNRPSDAQKAFRIDEPDEGRSDRTLK
ncbi:antibiotic biosynthesis monooxygenase [Occallatibacter savannae]|uniref:antibiotic biosynthesis monooxygenase n=1 Tax=Occallatibacter savannae TaxID=1002691 RepID=UPI000D69AB8D|nr:antibiotic biosynthesis monooxygenase [Occallatibacter savannae]